MDYRLLWTPYRSRARRYARYARYGATTKPRVFFLHIPKTAGTAVRESLLGREFEGTHAVGFGRHHLRLSDVDPRDEVVVVVRDPAERFVSAFYDRQRQGQPRYTAPWTAGEARLFGAFSTANELAENLGAVPVEDLADCFMLLPMTWWLGSVASFAAWPGRVTVLVQSDLAAGLSVLGGRLGLDLRLPVDDVGSHRGPVGVDRSLSAAGLASLREWYAEDYALLAHMGVRL